MYNEESGAMCAFVIFNFLGEIFVIGGQIQLDPSDSKQCSRTRTKI